MVRSETGGYAPDHETRPVRDDPSGGQPQVRRPGPTYRDIDLVHDLRARPRSQGPGWGQWRPLVGVLVAVVGYVLVAIPALIAYDVGVEGFGCDPSPHAEADFGCFGEPRPASGFFAFFTVLVTVPAALGLLVALPRRRGLALLVLACVALGLYTYLVLANPHT